MPVEATAGLSVVARNTALRPRSRAIPRILSLLPALRAVAGLPVPHGGIWAEAERTDLPKTLEMNRKRH